MPSFCSKENSADNNSGNFDANIILAETGTPTVFP